MIPTHEQIEQVAAAAWEGTGIYSGYHSFWNDPAQRAILKWEEVRPKDASQLQRTNHALAAELASVKIQRQQINLSMTTVVAEKQAEIERLKAELKESRDKVAGHEAHSKDWSPLVSFIQGSKYGTIGECCFAVALRQLKAFEEELAGIKSDCRLAESHYERAERMNKELIREIARLTALLGKYSQEEEAERRKFEQWYVENVFDLASDPIGSQLCGKQWAAWKARAAKGGSEA